MPNTDDRRSRAQRLLEYFGLAHPPQGAPTTGARRRSRYGVYVSSRLDEDLESMSQRIAALEDQIIQDRDRR
jgi:hypothetical protein